MTSENPETRSSFKKGGRAAERIFLQVLVSFTKLEADFPLCSENKLTDAHNTEALKYIAVANTEVSVS